MRNYYKYWAIWSCFLLMKNDRACWTISVVSFKLPARTNRTKTIISSIQNWNCNALPMTIMNCYRFIRNCSYATSSTTVGFFGTFSVLLSGSDKFRAAILLGCVCACVSVNIGMFEAINVRNWKRYPEYSKLNQMFEKNATNFTHNMFSGVYKSCVQFKIATNYVDNFLFTKQFFVIFGRKSTMKNIKKLEHFGWIKHYNINKLKIEILNVMFHTFWQYNFPL